MFAQIIQKKYPAVLMLLLLFYAAACQSGHRDEQTASLGVEQRQIETREISDDFNRKIRVPVKIERIISLAPSLTEAVFAVGAGQKLVGVTNFCNYPPEAKNIAKVGDTMKPNLETIIALKPQLVLLSTDSQLEAFLRQMETQSIPVFVTRATDFDGVLRNLKQIGDLLNAHAEAEKLVSDLQSRVAVVENKIKNEKPIRVFVQISREPLYTIGKASFLTDLVRRSGGESVTANIETGYPNVSRETALAAAPEAIILSVDESMGSQNAAPDDVFKNSPAVKNNKIFQINGDLLTRPSPRTAELIEQIAQALHPNVF